MSSTHSDLALPLAAAPPGMTPDFESITDTQMHIVITFGLTFLFATIFLALRLYTSLHLIKQLGWDAPLIILSWLASIAYGILLSQELKSGLGRHYWSVTTTQVVTYMNLVLPAFLVYIWAPALVKLSTLVFFHRIHPKMCFKYCSWLVGAFVITPTLAYTVLMVTVCNPDFSGQSDPEKCNLSVNIAQAATNIFANMLIIAMPLHMTMRLHVPKRKKIIMGCLITLGSFVVIFPIIRTAFLGALSYDGDFTFRQTDLAVWCGLELNFGIICACIPMLQPFVKQHMRWLSHIVGSTDECGRTRHRRGGRDELKDHVYILHSFGRAGEDDDASRKLQVGGANTTGQIIVTSEVRIVSEAKEADKNYYKRY